MSQALHHEAYFHRPIGEVFDFITTSGHWTRWHPATQSVVGQTTQPGRVGDESRERVVTAGIFPGHVGWRVVKCEPPRRWGIVTTRIDLPLLSGASVLLEYELIQEGAGTRLLRTFRYSLPRYLWLFDQLYFRSKMNGESNEALARLAALLEERGDLAA